MNESNLDQYATLKAKKVLSVEEKAVFDAIVGYEAAEDVVAKGAEVTPAFSEAADVLEDAQEALVAKPSTTV